jgi:PAS domain-containing protein
MVYLALGIAGSAAYLIGPLRGSGILMNALGLSPVIAIGVGVRLHRPAARTAWLLLAAGSALFWLGDLYTYNYERFAGTTVPFPSLGDVGYVAMYPAMMAGLLLLVRRRSSGSDRGGLLDGLVLTVGLALPSWVALIAPYLHQGDVGLWAKMTSVAYPMGDVILLGAAVRLALDSGRREPAFRALIASIALLTTTEFVYGILTLHGDFHYQLWLDLGWIGSYVLWGVAGLHPSMARLAEPVPGRESALTRFRLLLLMCSSLVAPVLAMANDVRNGDLDFVVIQICSITLFAVVVARMAALIRRQRQLSYELDRRRGEARFGALVGQASDLIVVFDPDGTVTYSSPSVARVLGRGLLDSFASDADRERLEHGLATLDGEPFECSLVAAGGAPREFELRFTNLLGTEHVGGILLNARDVSERKAFEARLKNLAFRDALTGLANRPMFIEHTPQALARSRREHSSLAVICLDLD